MAIVAKAYVITKFFKILKYLIDEATWSQIEDISLAVKLFIDTNLSSR